MPTYNLPAIILALLEAKLRHKQVELAALALAGIPAGNYRRFQVEVEHQQLGELLATSQHIVATAGGTG